MAKKCKRGANGAKEAKRLVVVDQRFIDLALIDPNPFNPREDFDPEELAELGQSLVNQGQTTPILLRPKKGRYELIAGERRLRAARVADLPTLRAEIVDCTDAEARGWLLTENLQRADFNPIEEARAFRGLIDAGDYSGPTELAAAFGVSQPYVSNRLRLLELPEQWQKRCISGEMSEKHLRAVATYKDYPAILEAIEKSYQDLGQPEREQMTAEWFAENVVHLAVTEGGATRPMENAHGQRLMYDDGRGAVVDIFEPTAEQEQQLRIIEVRGQRLATNTELWDRLQDEFLQEQDREDQEAPPDSAMAAATGTNGDEDLPAESSDTAGGLDGSDGVGRAESAEEADERAAKFARRLYAWKADWIRYRISLHLIDADAQDLAIVAMLALRHWNAATPEAAGRGRIEDAVLGSVPPRLRRDPLKAVLSLGPSTALGCLGLMLADLFWSEKYGPCPMCPDTDAEALADLFEINLGHAWMDEQAGPLSRRYWELHTKEQLAALAKELKAPEVLACPTKDAMVEAFLAHRADEDDDANSAAKKWLPMPREIKRARAEH